LDGKAEGEAATMRVVYMIVVVSGQGNCNVTAWFEVPGV
jgi:hypothetical protein